MFIADVVVVVGEAAAGKCFCLYDAGMCATASGASDGVWGYAK